MGVHDWKVLWLGEGGTEAPIDITNAIRTTDKEGPNGCRGLMCRQECRLEENYDRCLAYIEDNELTIRERVERIKDLRERLQRRPRPTASVGPTRAPLPIPAITPRANSAEVEERLFRERLRYQETLKRLDRTRRGDLQLEQPEDIEEFRERQKLDIRPKNRLNRFGGFISDAIKSFFD